MSRYCQQGDPFPVYEFGNPRLRTRGPSSCRAVPFHSRGFRYRFTQDRDRADRILVLPKHRGRRFFRAWYCFWHRHGRAVDLHSSNACHAAP